MKTEIFQPITTDLHGNLMTFLLIFAVSVVVLFLGNRKKVPSHQQNYKNLLLMLVFFTAIICAGSAFFSYWTTVKLTPVVVTETEVETPYGVVAFTDIRNAYFHEDKRTSRFSTEKVVGRTQFLIIEEYTRKTHALSEENYDIKKIFALLKERVKPKGDKR